MTDAQEAGPNASAHEAVFIACPIMSWDVECQRLVPVMQDASRDSPSLAVYLLAARLSAEGVACAVLDWTANPHWTIDHLARLAARSHVAYFSANSMNWGTVLALARNIRNRSADALLCVGGPHPTMFPEETLNSGAFDAVFRGEGDYWMASIHRSVCAGSNTTVPGLTLRGAPSKVEIHYETRLDAPNLADAYGLVPPGVFLSLPVQTSRGCMWNCSFCSIPRKNNWRGATVESAVAALRTAARFANRTASGIVSVIDDTFTTDQDRVIEICKQLDRERFAGRLTYDATLVDLRNRTMVEALAPFTSDLLVGAEVSSREDAKRITKAALPEMIEVAARNLRDAGISTRAVFSFIIGFPWHTMEDIRRTLALVTRLILEYGVRVYLQWYWPIPGSAIWRRLETEGRVSLDMADIPCFFLERDLFYRTRAITQADVAEVDDLMVPVKLCLLLHHGSLVRSPLSYDAPQFADTGSARAWMTRRNPFSRLADFAETGVQ